MGDFQVFTAPSGRKGLDILDNQPVDAMVSDYQMPEMNGLEFLRTVREKRGSEVPFIMFTGKGREEVAIKALNLGANRYLQKGGEPRSQYEVLAEAIRSEVEHVKAERERERARKEWKITFDALPDIATLVSPDHKFIRINEKGAETLGMSTESVIGKPCYELVHGRHSPIPECPCVEVIESGEPSRGKEFEENGRHYIAAASPIFDDEGGLEALAHTVKDITERKEIEEALRYNASRFRSLIENISDIILSLDTEGYVRYISPSVEKTLGYEPQEVIGSHHSSFVHPADEEKIFDEFGTLIKEPETFATLNFRLKHKDGSWRTLHSQGKSVSSGKDDEIILTLRDITEKREMEEKYRTVFENTGTATAIIEEDTTFSLVNRQFEALSGYSKNEIEGKMKSSDMVTEEYVPKILEYHRARREGANAPNRYELDFLDGRGSVKRVLLTIEVVPGTRKSVASLLDITDRKESEKVQSAMYRISKAASRANTPSEFYETVHSILKDLFYAENFYISLYHPRTGKVIFPYFSDRYDGAPESMSADRGLTGHVIHTGKPLLLSADSYQDLLDENEVEQLGREFSSWIGVPLKVDGEVIGMMAVQSYLEDVRYSDREKWIVEYVSEQIAMVIKERWAEEREEFLHSLLRHDVGNKVNACQGFLQLLNEKDLPRDQEELLQKAYRNLSAASKIIEKVRTLNMVGEEEIRDMDLTPIMRELYKEHSPVASEDGMTIELEVSNTCSKVQGGPLLKELFSNLISNSIEHSGGDRTRVTNAEHEDHVVYSVEDNGGGIPDDIKDTLFKRRVKGGKSAGSGFGLFLVQEIIERYGGKVKIGKSKLGGVRCDVYLNKAD